MRAFFSQTTSLDKVTAPKPIPNVPNANQEIARSRAAEETFSEAAVEEGVTDDVTEAKVEDDPEEQTGVFAEEVVEEVVEVVVEELPNAGWKSVMSPEGSCINRRQYDLATGSKWFRPVS